MPDMRLFTAPRQAVHAAVAVLCAFGAAVAAPGAGVRAAPEEPPPQRGEAAEPPAPLAAPPSWAPDVAEAGSVEAIAEWTTEDAYLPASVAYVPEDPEVPSPADVLGHHAGAPDHLSSVAEVHGYLRRLAAASPRVEVRRIGVSEEGREMLVALVSDAANLAALPRLAEIGRRLADPRGVDAAEAAALAAEGRAVYQLIGGLHSTETGSPEMLMELAYRLAVSERPENRRIRAEVVTAIVPIVEPDGRDRVVDWYRRHLAGRDLSWEEVRQIGSPPYWGHYVFHDNNRDGMQRALALTRAVHDLFWELRPQVVHDLHESLPLLYISTGHGPYSTAVDPLTVHEWTALAHHEAAALAAEGLPGVWTWGFWDGWWPGYLLSVANNHNAVGRFYETFGNSHPGTFERDLSKTRFVGQPVTDVEWYRPWPPDETVTWSLRDNTNYMQAGVLAGLGYVARHREELLTNVWRKAERAVDKGRGEAPYAWLLPPEQRDPGRLAYLVNQLLAQGVEVHRLVAPEAEPAAPTPPAEPAPRRRGRRAEPAAEPAAETPPAAPEPPRWPPGGYLVRMDQPHRNLALTLLDVQRFPSDEPNPPYDDVAWTWPLLYGVEAERIDDPQVLAAPMQLLAGPLAPGGGVAGVGAGVFLLADRGQTSLLAARVALAGWQVDAAEAAFDDVAGDYPAGSWIVQAPRAEVESAAGRFGLSFDAVSAMPAVRAHLLDLPRLGVVHTWTSTQSAGWVRYTLDGAGMPFELVSPDDLRSGALAARFDVLLVPDLGGDFARLVHGLDPAYGPLAYTATAEYPSHGVPNASPDVTGGMGLEGLLEIQRFARAGGVVVAIANGGTLAVDGGLVRDVRRLPASTVSNPGSELAARVVDRRHPLAYGYEERTSVFRGNGPLYEVPKRLRDRVVLQFGDELEERPAGRRAADGVGPLAATEVEVEDLDAEPVAIGAPAEEALAAGEVEVVEGEETSEEAAGSKDETPARALVLSGWVSKPDELAGKPAILDLPSGRGRVLIYAFDPLHRHLNHSDFRFLYNALLNWNDLP